MGIELTIRIIRDQPARLSGPLSISRRLIDALYFPVAAAGKYRYLST